MSKDKTEIKNIHLTHRMKNPRAALFSSLIESFENYKTNGSKNSLDINKYADYNIFFNYSGFETKTREMRDAIISLEDKSITIVDISDENFLSGPQIEQYLLLLVSAKFLTCSTESIQEMIYENTGRLAYLVPDPIVESQIEIPNKYKEEPKIFWYGAARDILSIRPELTKNIHKIKVGVYSQVSHTKDRAETVLIGTEKAKAINLKMVDIVYLPRTYTKVSEIDRCRKVEESIKAGKFVIAPHLEEYDWDELAFAGSLEKGLEFYHYKSTDVEKWVKDKQKILIQRDSKEFVEDSLLASLELAPEDSFIQDLTELLEQEVTLL
jgi:hypothetical protein